MVRQTLPGGLQCFYAWQGTGRDARVVRHWTDDGEAYVFEADLDQREVAITDQLGRVTCWAWNQDRQPTRYVDAQGHAWRFEWNAQRQLLSATDPAGHTTRFEYDERGRQTVSIDALGRVERTERNGFYDLPVSEIDPANARWIYRYDERGNGRRICIFYELLPPARLDSAVAKLHAKVDGRFVCDEPGASPLCRSNKRSEASSTDEA
jgi:YD repeat-containing protein